MKVLSIHLFIFLSQIIFKLKHVRQISFSGRTSISLPESLEPKHKSQRYGGVWPSQMAAQIIPGAPQFTRPELHGPSALGFDELVDFHLKHNPEHPFARLNPRTRKDRVLTVTWRELSEAVHRAGHALQASFGSFDAASPPVVGLLIPDDGIPYITIQLALIRIGLIVSRSLLYASCI